MSLALKEGTDAVVAAHQALPPAARYPSVAAWPGRILRSIAQLFLFAAFGLGGAAMTLVVAPALFVAVRDPLRRRANARRCVRHLLRAFTGAMQSLRLLRVEVAGAEHLDQRGVLTVANHPTLIDAFFLLARVDALVPIAKRSLLANPFTRGAIRAADYLINDDGPALVEACRERLARGESLLLFPEGTRTAADGTIRFRRGAAQLAVRSGCRVVPVTVSVSERFLTRGHPWWLASATRPNVRIVAHPPIDPAPFAAASPNPALAARRLNGHLIQLFAKELAARGSV